MLSAKLMNRATLPYNPYPGFIRRMRMGAEKYTMFRDTDENIKKTLSKRFCQIKVQCVCTYACIHFAILN